MNQIAKELREAADYMKREGVDLLGAVIRLNNTFDAINPGTPAANLGAIIAHIADELDELDDKAARRRSHIVRLESTIAERNRELRELRKRVPSERERQILGMWPRFEDGEPVMIGDGVDSLGGEIIEVYIAGNAAAIWNNCGNHMHLSLGERVKRPARSALDADGVEIRVGDTVWHEDGTELIVIAFGDVQDGETMLDVEYVSGPTEWDEVRCLSVTHTRPDSWERLEEDAEKLACAYLGRSEGTCFGCPLENCKDFAACSKEQAKDIVRRAKALAGVEVD